MLDKIWDKKMDNILDKKWTTFWAKNWTNILETFGLGGGARAVRLLRSRRRTVLFNRKKRNDNCGRCERLSQGGALSLVSRVKDEQTSWVLNGRSCSKINEFTNSKARNFHNFHSKEVFKDKIHFEIKKLAHDIEKIGIKAIYTGRV